MTLDLRFSMLIRLRLSGISVVDTMRRDDLQGGEGFTWRSAVT